MARLVKALVVDASALGEYLLCTPQAAIVEEVFRQPDVDIHTAALCDVEVSAIIRSALRAGHITTDRAADAVNDL